jgi:penicillin-binding protein 2
MLIAGNRGSIHATGRSRALRINQLIPSMFHRRLMLLYAMVCLGMLGLTTQLARLTVVQHDKWLESAERPLIRTDFEATVRGRILDRKGRVLAMNQPSYELAVDFRLIAADFREIPSDYRTLPNDWAVKQASGAAWKQNRDAFAKIAPEARNRIIVERYLPAFDAQIETLWLDISRASGTPLGDLAATSERIHRQVMRQAKSVWEAQRLHLENLLNEDLAEEDRRTVSLDDIRRPILEQVQPHPVLTQIDDETAFALRKIAEAWPDGEVVVRDGGKRTYPYEAMDVPVDFKSMPAGLRADRSASVRVDGVAAHILGRMRSVYTKEDADRRAEDLQARGEPGGYADHGRYLPGDSAGLIGMEYEREFDLRGSRGVRRLRLDTGEEEESPPAQGADVSLTIDIALQARIQAALTPEVGLAQVQPWHANPFLKPGTPLAASAVVLDIESGDVLAMVSTPTFTRAQLQDDPDSVFKDRKRPAWVNRAIDSPYPPGSIVKPLVLVWTVSRGLHELSRTIPCQGHLLPNRDDVYRCWIYRARYGYMTHSQQLGHDLRGEDAVGRSCNIYFNVLGRIMGPARIADFYRDFGVGHERRLGVGGAFTGAVGYPDPRQPIEPNDAIMMAIGQGPVSWTPLHAADAYATLARGGVRLEPRLDASIHRRPVDLEFDRAAIAAALDGLWQSANEPFGTGNHLSLETGTEPIFNAPGIEVRAKTGTAQAPRIYLSNDDPRATSDLLDNPADDSIGPLDPSKVLLAGEHSWTSILVGPEGMAPRHAIAVLVEYGGSGGRVAGPISNQIVHALIAEGYLPSFSVDRSLDEGSGETGGGR